MDGPLFLKYTVLLKTMREITIVVEDNTIMISEEDFHKFREIRKHGIGPAKLFLNEIVKQQLPFELSENYSVIEEASERMLSKIGYAIAEEEEKKSVRKVDSVKKAPAKKRKKK